MNSDNEVLELMQVWRNIISDEGNVQVGMSKVLLQNKNCGSSECNVGNFYCDAILHATLHLTTYNEHKWADVSIALKTSSEMYVSIARGPITYSQIFALAVYENELVAFDLPGEQLLSALEHSVSGIDLERNITSTYTFMQVSGLKITYDLHAPSGRRVVRVQVRCAACNMPKYLPLVKSQLYRIVSTRYLVGGGYGYTMFAKFGTAQTVFAITEFQGLLNYLHQQVPITAGVENRIQIL